MIKLKRLVLENFMCIENADLSFDEGVTLIVGSNGHGKSAVLQAVTLCLLEERRSDSFKEFIMLGKDYTTVSLDAEISGVPIQIGVTINKKVSNISRTATYNGRVYTNSEVSDLLETFDLKYYADIIMSMQDSGDITKLKPAEREAYLQKLFQFDFTERVDKLKETLDNIKESIDYQTAQIDFNTKSIEDRKKEILEVKQLAFTTSDISNLNNNISSLNEELSSLTEKIKVKDNLSQEKATVQGEAYSVKQSIDSLKHEIELIKSNQGMIDTLQAKVAEYDSSNNSLESSKLLINETLSDLNSKIALASTEKEEISKNLGILVTNHTNMSAELNALNMSLANKNADVIHAQKHMDMVKLGTCPECGHSFDRGDISKYSLALRDSTKAYVDEETVRNSKMEELTNLDSNIKAEREKLHNKEVEINTLNKDVSTSDFKIKNIESQINSNNVSKERLISQIEQYASKMSDIADIEQKISEQTEKLSELNEKINSIDSKLGDMCNLSDTYTTKQVELSNLQQTLADYNNEVSKNNLIIKNNENIKNSIEDMEAKIQESKSVIDGYRRQKNTYDEAIVLLDKTFPAWLILKTCQRLEEEMNSFIQVVFPLMEVKLFQNKRGVEFFYTRNKNNGRILTKDNLINAKMASGFEKAILSVAFKVALCRAYNLRFAFMDEIDQAGTEENSEALYRAILSNDLFDQLFVISHKPTVRDAIHSFAPSLRTFYVDNGKFTTDNDV